MFLRHVLLGLGVWLAVVTTCGWGQSKLSRPLPPPKPLVSPYLNLYRAGNTQAFNYLTLVRPELDMRQSLDVLTKQGQQPQSKDGQAGAEAELTTGHAVGFMTHNRFFMTMGKGSSGPLQKITQPVPNQAKQTSGTSFSPRR